MIQLIYLSRAVRRFPEQELIDLLARARRNNETLGVTGMLVHHRGQFLQVLEGAEATVRRLFESISCDQRHEQIDELVSLQVTQRAFGDWTMGFYNADVETLAANPAFQDFFGRSFSRQTFADDPSIAAKLLLSFRDGRMAASIPVGASSASVSE